MKKNEPFDPKVDRMVAALYGELPDRERREFEAMLASDPELKAEWDELSSTRSLLGSWEMEERAPSFVMVGASSSDRRRPLGWWARMNERFGGWFTFGGWVVAGAAAAILLVSANGVSIHRTAGGNTVVEFGRKGHTVDQAVNGATPANPGGVNPLAEEQLQPISSGGGSTYLTRDEFDQYSAAMLRMMTAYMSDYRNRRDQEIGAALRTLYGDIDARQSSQYHDLVGRIDAVRLLDREGPATRATELGMSHADSLGPLHQDPDVIEVKKNE